MEMCSTKGKRKQIKQSSGIATETEASEKPSGFNGIRGQMILSTLEQTRIISRII